MSGLKAAPGSEPAFDHEGATLIAVVGTPTAASPGVASGTGAVSQAAASSERQRLAGRYEIVALVGAGGMGTVYRARDLELEEVVALKVVRRELCDTPGILDRFRREAKLARRVTHRNVARVFDIGEHEGEKFLTMEFVEGESLAAALARDGAFSLERAVAVGTAVAEGLASAHAAGVLHRDLKPDNVLLGKDGRVVITDFGIARALADARAVPGGASSTMGVPLGTPAYMAPEQVEGRPDIDARADVYAFGALLYELFTGCLAWPGDSPFSVASARLIRPPPDPRGRRRDLPASCAELVLRCMARAPADRPATMSEAGAALAVALAVPSGGADAGAASPTPTPAAHARPAEKTVAVLPFRNAGAPDDAYLAEELTDDLLDALSMTRGLRVRPRGAVLRFRGADTDPREIGRELGVQVVVEGSVRRAGGRVRISARLVSVADGFQIWAKRFDRPEQDVLSINDEAACAIAEALTLDGGPLRGRAREAPASPLAIDLYLRARHEYRQMWPEHVRRAIELFDQALAIAPDDPLLLSGLAMALSRVAFWVGAAGVARAREVAQRAVLAAPQLGEAQLAYGSMLFQLGENTGAARALRAAVAQSPGLAEAHGALGRLLTEAGAADEGIRLMETAVALDPATPLVGPDSRARLRPGGAAGPGPGGPRAAAPGGRARLLDAPRAPGDVGARGRGDRGRHRPDPQRRRDAAPPQADAGDHAHGPGAGRHARAGEGGARPGRHAAPGVHAPAPRRGPRLRRRRGAGAPRAPGLGRGRAHRSALAGALPAPRRGARGARLRGDPRGDEAAHGRDRRRVPVALTPWMLARAAVLATVVAVGRALVGCAAPPPRAAPASPPPAQVAPAPRPPAHPVVTTLDSTCSTNRPPPDPARVAADYQRACDAGEPAACANRAAFSWCGWGMPRDATAAIALARQDCDRGVGAACDLLGVFYMEQTDDPGSAGRAVDLLRATCARGVVSACANLGGLYLLGRGVPRDATRAITLFEDACRQDHASACATLAAVLAVGSAGGPPPDPARAAALAEKGCSLGDLSGCTVLGVLALGGSALPPDEPRAVALFTRACDGGVAAACSNLAVMYWDGKGVPRDRARTKVLLAGACEQGNVEACRMAKEIGAAEGPAQPPSSGAPASSIGKPGVP